MSKYPTLIDDSVIPNCDAQTLMDAERFHLQHKKRQQSVGFRLLSYSGGLLASGIGLLLLNRYAPRTFSVVPTQCSPGSP